MSSYKRIVYHKMNRSVLKMKFGTFEKRCSTEVKVETDDWLIDDSNVSLDISKEIQCTLRHNILIGCLELFNKESLYRINVVGQLMMIFLHFIAHLDQWLTNPQWNSGIHNSFENGSKCVEKRIFGVVCSMQLYYLPILVAKGDQFNLLFHVWTENWIYRCFAII